MMNADDNVGEILLQVIGTNYLLLNFNTDLCLPEYSECLI